MKSLKFKVNAVDEATPLINGEKQPLDEEKRSKAVTRGTKGIDSFAYKS